MAARVIERGRCTSEQWDAQVLLLLRRSQHPHQDRRHHAEDLE
eukprot:SAG31_NODE_44827_length_261_cov_0.641975_1_plen_42_part_10